MMKSNKNKKKQFCVVQFTELPFESIDDYVCVPNSWVILRRYFADRKAIVAHPEDEDPFETRARARRKESYGDNWKVYRATIKYESDSYSDAEYWIRTINDYGPIKEEEEEEDSDFKDPEPEPVLDRKLRRTSQYPTSNFSSDKNKVIVKPYGNSRKPMIKMSIKRPIQSEPKNELSEKRPKIDKTAESNRVTINTSIRPGSSKRKHSTIVRDDPSISAETKESAATSNSEKSTEKIIESHHAREDKPLVQPGPFNTLQSTSSTLSGEKQSSPIYQDCEKDPNMPLLDVHKFNEVISIDQEIQTDSIEERRSSSSQTPPPTSEQQCQLMSAQERHNFTDPLEYLLRKQYIRGIPVKRPEKTNDNSQNTDLQCNTMAALTAPKPLSTTNQHSQSNQHTELPYLTINRKSYQDLKPREIREERPTEVSGDDENPHNHTITNKIPSTSHYLSNSMKLSTEICNFRRAKLLSSINDNSVANNSLRLANQSSSLPMRSMERQAHLVTQNQQEVPRVQEMHDRRLIEGNSSNQRFLPQSSSSSSRKVLNTQNTQIRRPSEEKYTDHRTCHQGITNKMSDAQIASQLAHHSHCCIQKPDEQQYLPNQKNNSQQISQVRDTVKIPTQNQDIDHSIHDEFMKQILAIQNKPHPANQPSCSLFRNENQRIQVDQDYLKNERLTEEQLRRLAESRHTDHRPHPQNVRMNIPSTVQNSSNVINQFDNNPELLQQRQSNHQKPQQDPKMPKIRVDINIKTRNDSHQPELRGVIKKIQPLPVLPKDSNTMRQSFLNNQRNYSIRDPRIQARLNERFTEQNNNARAAYPQNIMVEPLAVRQNSEVQPTSSSKRLHETEYKQVHDNQVYQNPRTFKMVVNQSNETNATTKHVHFEDNIVRSPPIESSSVVMNKMCQTDEYFSGKSLSPDRALVSDHEVVITHEVVSDYDMSTEETPVEIINDAGSPKERIPPESDSSVRSIANQPTTSSNQVHPRIIIEQKMLYEFAALFTQMGTTMSQTNDMFKSLRSSILDSAKIYKKLIEAVHTFNALGNFLNPATPSCLVSETSHITEKRQTGEENPNNDNNTVNSIDEKPKLNQSHRRTFVLPPECDPNDSKWTLKYRRSMPGLVELMPQSDIYVSYSQLEHFKQTSRDCKTLAQMLLTEVFSMSALSVCSLTGRKAKASDDEDNVRPGLDRWAIMVLLKFVERFGLQCGWNITDTGIIISMRDKIDEIRAKYGQRSRF